MSDRDKINSNDSVVTEVSVQVSEYSARNGGSDDGSTLYLVEILYLDGTYDVSNWYRDLSEAREAAKLQAVLLDVRLLSQSIWPTRQVHEGRA